LPVFTEDDANGIVATAPYSATVPPTRRREDGPAGALQLSEMDIIADTRPNRDVIELADFGVESGDGDEVPIDPVKAEMEDIQNIVSEGDNVSPDRPSPIAMAATDIVAEDELPLVNAMRQRTDSAAKYIETHVVDTLPNTSSTQSGLGLWIPVLLGFILLGASGATLLKGAEALLGTWGPIIAFTGLVIGVGLILTGIYAALRMNSRK